jgi:hypothetical protein
MKPCHADATGRPGTRRLGCRWLPPARDGLTFVAAGVAGFETTRFALAVVCEPWPMRAPCACRGAPRPRPGHRGPRRRTPAAGQGQVRRARLPAPGAFRRRAAQNPQRQGPAIPPPQATGRIGDVLTPRPAALPQPSPASSAQARRAAFGVRAAVCGPRMAGAGQEPAHLPNRLRTGCRPGAVTAVPFGIRIS